VELARDVLVFLHLVGFAALLGGAVVQFGDAGRVVNKAMVWGALAMVLTGIGLVGVIEGLDETVDRPKIAVKFGVALVIALLCWANRARTRVPRGLCNAIVLLVLADLGVSVFW
jgi:hypothetical protein